jgi:hypothetical protein
MAGFLLDICGKSESNVFLRRFQHDSFDDEAVYGTPDFDFAIVAVDPYKDSSWSGKRLMQWGKEVRGQFESCVAHINSQVLEKVRRDKIEPWMAPVIDQKKKSSREYAVLKKLIEMIERAEKNNGTIVFFGD